MLSDDVKYEIGKITDRLFSIYSRAGNVETFEEISEQIEMSLSYVENMTYDSVRVNEAIERESYEETMRHDQMLDRQKLRRG